MSNLRTFLEFHRDLALERICELHFTRGAANRPYNVQVRDAGRTRTIGSATAWKLNEWYVIELEAQATTPVGRLYEDYTEATVREEVRATLNSVAPLTFVGMIPGDTQEPVDWFQSGVRQAGSGRDGSFDKQ